MSFLQDITTTLIFHIGLSASHLGLGWIASRFLSLQFRRSEKLFSYIWLGWAVTLLLLQITNFLFPINAIVSLLLLLIGIVSFGMFLWNGYRRGNTFYAPRAWLVFIGLAAVWIAALSMQAPKAYDSGRTSVGTLNFPARPTSGTHWNLSIGLCFPNSDQGQKNDSQPM